MKIGNRDIGIRQLFKLLVHFLPSKKKEMYADKIGITSFVCHRDVCLLALNLTSFFYHLGKQLPVFVIDDGTLTPRDYRFLRRLFFIEIQSMKKTKREILKRIKDYPHYREYWLNDKTDMHKHKLDAVILSPFDKFIYLDADIIFFNKPKEIIKWIDHDQGWHFITDFNQTFKAIEIYRNTETYYFRKLLFRNLKINKEPYFNSAFMCFPNKAVIDFKTIDKVLKIFNELGFKFNYFAEETIFSILFQKVKYSSLNPNQYLNSPHVINKSQRVMHHYPLENKQLLYSDGIREMLNHFFYRKKL